MGARTKQTVGVGVDLFTRSATYVMNSILQSCNGIIRYRGLDPMDLAKDRKTFEDGLWTWLVEKSLRGLYVEFSVGQSSSAVERWHIELEYYDDPNGSDPLKPPLDQIKDFGQRLGSLPPGTDFTIYVSLTSDASSVQGWTTGQLKDLEGPTQNVGSDWGYGNIFGTLSVKSSLFDDDWKL